jgi:hypothetical protein
MLNESARMRSIARSHERLITFRVSVDLRSGVLGIPTKMIPADHLVEPSLRRAG